MHNITDAIDLQGRVAIAAVDFHRTRIYALDSPDHTAPEHVDVLLAANIVATACYFAAGRVFWWLRDGRRRLLDEARHG